jgi:hypothetical protein
LKDTLARIDSSTFSLNLLHEATGKELKVSLPRPRRFALEGMEATGKELKDLDAAPRGHHVDAEEVEGRQLGKN